MNCAPAKNIMKDKSFVATVSALPYPYGCSGSGGLAIIAAANNVMRDMTMSVAESIPSPITAMLPESTPIRIFADESAIFPVIPIQDAIFICLFLSISNLRLQAQSFFPARPVSQNMHYVENNGNPKKYHPQIIARAALIITEKLHSQSQSQESDSIVQQPEVSLRLLILFFVFISFVFFLAHGYPFPPPKCRI